ncbi:hypothetical protein ACFYY8_27365 [Streptosporangium sp. NPDC001559]|uniref:Uncharacterized protein n=1 Tax=Streptosporangium jomthongense TaxID=1193683 RepID=A0ABV8ETI7_9ACTN
MDEIRPERSMGLGPPPSAGVVGRAHRWWPSVAGACWAVHPSAGVLVRLRLYGFAGPYKHASAP